MNSLAAIRSLVSGVDTNSALERFKQQGQAFAHHYAEFVFLRDYALTKPEFRNRWISLNNIAVKTRRVIALANSQFDAANKIVEMALGVGLLNISPEISNGYLVSSNAALTYLNMELAKFNQAVTMALQNEAQQNDGNNANTQ